ncbi:P22 coat protein Gp5 [Haloactinopolyspora alba]|uniref:P22 coat protein Gp5 n=1 Tax=Haloactinopolyspora alba TaxID=648780 RepID=A0A2P8DF03_9ACTN|nr:P22 phage major capsid protein family protein [Haloactinopolyspora alba]PSK95778.1 P22 coat protein Gp5 [Haloactinopolyspora alba]
MPNSFLTPQVIATRALANLYETTVMAPLVHRDYEQEFVAKVGDTITIRQPAVFTADEYNGTSINVQDATENGIPVVLNHFADVSFSVTSKQMTLDIEDFSEQLLDPAMEAISQKIDRDILAFRNDVTAEVGVVAGDNLYDWSNPRTTIDAGRVLNLNNVPTTERRAIVGPTISASWMGDDLLNRSDARGDTEGLREANLGRRLFGFDPYMTQNIEPPASSPAIGEPTTEVGVGFHRTAVALATRPLALPRGAQNAAIASYKGFGLRVIMDYDMDTKSDIVSVDCLYGVKTLDSARAVLIKGPDQT